MALPMSSVVIPHPLVYHCQCVALLSVPFVMRNTTLCPLQIVVGVADTEGMVGIGLTVAKTGTRSDEIQPFAASA